MNNKKETTKKAAPLLTQLGIFGVILFVSSLISALFPANFPVPTPVIGLVILYLLLTFKIIKPEQVEKVGSFFIGILGFLFVPSGIQLAASPRHHETFGSEISDYDHHLNGCHASLGSISCYISHLGP